MVYEFCSKNKSRVGRRKLEFFCEEMKNMVDFREEKEKEEYHAPSNLKEEGLWMRTNPRTLT